MHKSLFLASEFIAGNETISFAVIFCCTTRPMRYKQRRQPCRTINCHKPNCHHEMHKSHVKTTPLTGRRGPFGSCSSTGMKHRCLFQGRQGRDAPAWPPRHQDEGLGHPLASTHGGQSSNPKSCGWDTSQKLSRFIRPKGTSSTQTLWRAQPCSFVHVGMVPQQDRDL